MNDRIVARAPFPNVDKTKGLVCDENADRFNVFFYTDVCSMKTYETRVHTLGATISRITFMLLFTTFDRLGYQTSIDLIG